MPVFNHGQVSEELRNKVKKLLELNYEVLRKRFGDEPLTGLKQMYYTTLLCDQYPERTRPENRKLLQDCADEIHSIVYPGQTRRMMVMGFMSLNAGGVAGQGWHYDYRGLTETIFVPFCPLDDTNGTPYVEFDDVATEEKVFWDVKDHVNKIQSFDLVENLPPHRLKRINANAFDVVQLGNTVLHSGANNLSPNHREMFYVCSTHDPTYMMEDFYVEPIIVNGEEIVGENRIRPPELGRDILI